MPNQFDRFLHCRLSAFSDVHMRIIKLQKKPLQTMSPTKADSGRHHLICSLAGFLNLYFDTWHTTRTGLLVLCDTSFDEIHAFHIDQWLRTLLMSIVYLVKIFAKYRMSWWYLLIINQKDKDGIFLKQIWKAHWITV